MDAFKTYPGTLYKYSAGAYCGVLVTERVMRKLAKLQAAHLESVKRLLADSVDEVFPSMWTLHHPDGKQTHVEYIDLSRSAQRSIESAGVAHPPVACFPVFIAASMDEAKRMADARHESLVPA